MISPSLCKYQDKLVFCPACNQFIANSNLPITIATFMKTKLDIQYSRKPEDVDFPFLYKIAKIAA